MDAIAIGINALVDHEEVFLRQADHAGPHLLLLRRANQRDGGRDLAHIVAVFVNLKVERVDDIGMGAVHGAFSTLVFQFVVANDKALGRGVGFLVVGHVARDLGHIHGAAYQANKDEAHGEVAHAASQTTEHAPCVVRALRVGFRHAHQLAAAIEDEQTGHEEAEQRESVVVGRRTLLENRLGIRVACRHHRIVRRHQHHGPVRGERHKQDERADAGNECLLEEACGVGLAPAQERTHGHDQQIRCANGASDRIVGGCRHAAAAIWQPFGKSLRDGEIAQHEGQQYQDDVVDEEEAVFAEHAFALRSVLVCHKALAADDARDGAHEHADDNERAKEHEAHIVAGEGVNGFHQAAARDECAHDAEAERQARAHDGPALEHAPVLVHGEAVDKRRGNEPWQKRGIFNRVPAPVSAPAQHYVGPHGTKANAHGEEHPCGNGKAFAAQHPFLARVVYDACANGIRERYGKAGIAQEEHRRMDRHSPMLEQRVHAKHAGCGGERAIFVEVLGIRHGKGHVAFAEQQDADERDEHQLHDEHRHVVQRLRLSHAAKGDKRCEEADEPCPEHERTCASGPQAADAIERAEKAGFKHVVFQNVLDAAIAYQEAVDHDRACHGKAYERDDGGEASGPAERGAGVAPFERVACD